MGGPTATTATSTYPAGTASRRTGDRRGEQWSTGPGLCYYRARYYNPQIGRFLSEDPLGFAGSGPNLYADPFGMDKKDNFSKHFGKTIQCTSSASDVMNYVETSFGSFGDYSRWGGLESVLFSPPSGMGVGSAIPINIGTFGLFQTLSVNVQAINPQSMTFTTNPGHLLYPANITFSASAAAQGSINFNIDLGGTIANSFEFYTGGSSFEDAQWNHFLDRVSSFCEEQ